MVEVPKARELDGGAQPSKRRTAGNATVDAIKDYILEHRLHPGDPLPTEAVLQEILGVSRSSVREALRTLQSLDIVSIQHGRGMSVGGLSFSPMIEAVLFRARLNAKDDLSTLREVVEVRMALDLSLTDELISAYRGSSQPKLRQHVENMRECVAAGEGFAPMRRSVPLRPACGDKQPHDATARYGILADPHRRRPRGGPPASARH